MKLTLGLCWILLLSWLTHMAASPAWRLNEQAIELLNSELLIDSTQWQAQKQALELGIDSANVLSVKRQNAAKGVMSRTMSLPANAQMLRVQAQLQAEPLTRDSFTLFPPPAIQLMAIRNGVQSYPMVERPMFFQRIHSVDDIVAIGANTQLIQLGLVGSPGSDWRVSNLRVSVVEEHWRYAYLFQALVALWALTVLWVVVQAWRRAKVPTFAVAAVVFLVLIGILASDPQIDHARDLIAATASSLGGEITSQHFRAAMQFGHIFLFFSLTGVMLLGHRRWGLHIFQALMSIVVVAIATEALQSHVPGRDPDVQDFLFDMLGVCFGAGVYFLALWVNTQRYRLRVPTRTH